MLLTSYFVWGVALCNYDVLLSCPVIPLHIPYLVVCFRQLWCSSTILCNITSISYNRHTDIYSLNIYITYLSPYLSPYPSTSLPVSLSIYLSTYPSTYLPIHLPPYLPPCLPPSLQKPASTVLATAQVAISITVTVAVCSPATLR